MIERLGPNSAGTVTQAIQSVTAPPTPGVVDSRQAEVLVHNASLIGETHWMGAMNAYRIARTLEAQQQLIATNKSGTATADPATNLTKGAPIRYDIGLLESTRQSGEPALIPTIPQMDDDPEISNHLGRQLELGREARLFAAGTNTEMAGGVTKEAVEVAGAFETNTVMGTRRESRQIRDDVISATPKRKDGGEPQAIVTRPAVYRGNLVRLGQTSQFVPEIPT